MSPTRLCQRNSDRYRVATIAINTTTGPTSFDISACHHDRRNQHPEGAHDKERGGIAPDCDECAHRSALGAGTHDAVLDGLWSRERDGLHPRSGILEDKGEADRGAEDSEKDDDGEGLLSRLNQDGRRCILKNLRSTLSLFGMAARACWLLTYCRKAVRPTSVARTAPVGVYARPASAITGKADDDPAGITGAASSVQFLDAPSRSISVF